MLSPDFFKSAFEISLFILFFLCLIHSYIVHGWQRTLREFAGGFTFTLLCESAGVLSGAYVYPGFSIYVLSVPFVNPASWIALIYIIMHLSDQIILSNKWFKNIKANSIFIPLFIIALTDAFIALGLDLVLDPLASIYNWWVWVPLREGVHTVIEGTVDPYNFDSLKFMVTPDNWLKNFFAPFFEGQLRYPTRILGIPLINFIAWFVFVFVFTFQFRLVESKTKWTELKKTLVLWMLIIISTPILCFILIYPNI